MKRRLFDRYVWLGMCIWPVLLLSCQKNAEGENSTSENKQYRIYTGDYTRWVYFSFEKKDTVHVSHPAQSKEWDLAFHRWDIRTNGGLSAQGQGAAFKTMALTMDASLSLPKENQWVKDSLVLTYMNKPDMSGENNQQVSEPANTVLSGWLSVFMGQIPPVYTMAKEVFFIRSAQGQIYRLQFSNYMNDRAEKGYAVFSYRQEK